MTTCVSVVVRVGEHMFGCCAAPSSFGYRGEALRTIRFTPVPLGMDRVNRVLRTVGLTCENVLGSLLGSPVFCIPLGVCRGAMTQVSDQGI